jgi:D-alanine-D-alanine ligase
MYYLGYDKRSCSLNPLATGSSKNFSWESGMTEQLRDKKVVVLYGGSSSEREVSLRSGRAVYEALLSKGYRVELLDAAGDLCEGLNSLRPDIVFIALHGGVGENGAIQGFLEVLGIPYTGSGRLASALAMDKVRTKTRLLSEGINTTPYIEFHRSEALLNGDLNKSLLTKAIEFPLPWVVKPVSEGSSIGVHIIHTEEEIEGPVMDALKYDSRIILEQYIKGREIHIAVLGGRSLGGVEVRPSSEFYDYTAKYTPGMTEYILPPEIPEDIYLTMQDMAVRSHRALGCKGATRVDLILSQDMVPYVLEVNTIPGMTATSLLPKIARQQGISFEDLVETILLEAIEDPKA